MSINIFSDNVLNNFLYAYGVSEKRTNSQMTPVFLMSDEKQPGDIISLLDDDHFVNSFDLNL